MLVNADLIQMDFVATDVSFQQREFISGGYITFIRTAPIFDGNDCT